MMACRCYCVEDRLRPPTQAWAECDSPNSRRTLLTPPQVLTYSILYREVLSTTVCDSRDRVIQQVRRYANISTLCEVPYQVNIDDLWAHSAGLLRHLESRGI